MKKISLLLKKKKYLYVVAALALIVAGLFLFKNGKKEDETIVVHLADFINQVSVSGKVVATDDVDLSFKNEGLVKQIYFKVGQEVKNGFLIAKIDAKDAEKSLHDAEINLESAKLDLEKIKLQNSEVNLSSSLLSAYDDGFTAVSETFLDLSPIVNKLENLFGESMLSANSARNSGQVALNYRESAEELFYRAKDSFEKNREIFRLLDRDSSPLAIEDIINKTYETTKIFSDAVKSMKSFVDYLSGDTGTTLDYSSFQDALSLYANTINGHFSKLLSSQIDIKNNKDAFSSTSIDIQDALLVIKQRETALQDAKNKLEDYYIRAPFDGIITKIDAKVGEVASSNTPLISMISADIFQIESYVPEVSIAQIKLEDEASITLDAYGEGVAFFAKVVSIDPAETVRDGVSTYRIKLQFREKDDRIKSGMTANVSITTFNKPSVIVVPGGVVFEKDGKKFVKIKVGNKIINKEIETGSVSSLGQIEIVSGLRDGDMVMLNPQ